MMKNNINLLLRRAVILSLATFLMINLATTARAETLEEALNQSNETT